MDIFLLIGIVVGLCAVSAGLLMKGASVAILFSPEAIMVILVGTFAAVMNSFPKKEFFNIPKILGVLFKDKEKESSDEIIKYIIELSQETRKNGLLSLESKISGLDNKFMKVALEMAVDGVEPNILDKFLWMKLREWKKGIELVHQFLQQQGEFLLLLEF